MKKILIFAPYFIPAFKAGGPVKSIKNIIELLGDEFEFLIVTRDRDIGDTDSYKNISTNQWVAYDKVKVFYLPPKNLTLLDFSRLIKDSSCDVLYLNSFFDKNFTIKVLLAHKIFVFKKVPIILAPRGEFSIGALQIETRKKQLFIWGATLLGLYKNIVWHASTGLEKKDILSVFSVNASQVRIAKNLPSKLKIPDIKKSYLVPSDNALKIIFLSRISQKKNLDYALRVLQNIQSPVCFDIYGPVEDLEYWSLCKELIKKMPNNVVVNYHGSVKPEEVSTIFSSQDLFFFPTRGENYGHVIAESLLVGTPVLLSDQTPWRNLEKDSLGLDLSLSDNNSFADAIEYYCNLKVEERVKLREKIQINAYERIFNAKDIEANKELFLFAINDFNVK